MPLTPLVEEQVYQRWRAYLEATTALRAFYLGSLTDGLGHALGFVMDDGFFQMAKAVDLYPIDRCYKTDLDERIKDLHGCPARQGAQFAYGEGQFIREIVDGGPPITTPISIPSGTTVLAPATTLVNARSYTTTSAGTIPAGSMVSNTVQFVAPTAGSAYNVAAGEITTLAAAIAGVGSFSNSYDVLTGTEAESDDQVKARAKRWIAGLSRGVVPALVQAMLGVAYGTEYITSCAPYESDTPGRVTLFIDNGYGTPSDDLLALAQKVADGYVRDMTNYFGYRAAGVRVTVRRPVVVWLTINAALTLNANYIGVSQSSVASRARRAVITYIYGLQAGQTVSYNKLLTVLMSSVPDVITDATLTVNGGMNDITIPTHMIAKVRTADVNVA